MDKRTLIFVICLTATFFGLNLIFSGQRDEEARKNILEQELISSQEQSALQASTAEKIVPLEALPLVDLTIDGERITSGAKIENAILTLAWDETLPDQVEVEGKTYPLNTETVVVGHPVVYGETLDIGVVPKRAREDLQLVVPGLEGVPATVSLGELEGGMVRVVLSPPQSNALVFRKQGAVYLPIGTYRANEKKFVPLIEDRALAVRELIPQVTPQDRGERFYVLENDYQQLVFSNYGGALAEINLPFTADIVKEIGFDREMIEEDPANSHFPDFPYYIPGENTLKTERQLGGYYPLLRRALIDENGQVLVSIPPQYYAFNTISKYPEVAKLVYEVVEFTPERIVFESVQNRRTIRKTYTLPKEAPYMLDVAIEVGGDLVQGLYVTSGVPEVEWMSGRSSPALKVRLQRGNKFEVNKISRPKADQMIAVGSVHPEWISNGNGFFGLIMDPMSEIGAGYRVEFVSGEEVPSRLVLIDRKHKKFKAPQLPGYQTLLPLTSGKMSFRLYAGPYDNTVLKQVDSIYPGSNYLSARSFHGYLTFISKPFAKFLLVIMDFFHWLTNSWALSIILLTIVLRLMLYPLSAWSMKSMRRMQKIQPEVSKIQKKYKKDPRRSQVEIMQLYRKRKVNPFSGCLPLIIQMPFLIGMFDLLKSTFALRGAPFIPGWINDLTAPDVLFNWGTPIFFFGTSLHLLPFLLGGVMFLQQRLSSTLPKDKSLWTDQQKQQRMMGNVMAIFFMVMFYNFPSGLNIYWLSSMSLGILQQWIINKRMDHEPTKRLAKT